MIQRIQSVLLLLAFLAGIGLFLVPVFTSGSFVIGGLVLVLTALVAMSAFESLVAIFLFKNRKVQMLIAISAGLVALGAAILVNILGMKGAVTFPNSFSALAPYFMIVLNFAAAYFIKKDEKLVKSLDRLR